MTGILLSLGSILNQNEWTINYKELVRQQYKDGQRMIQQVLDVLVDTTNSNTNNNINTSQSTSASASSSSSMLLLRQSRVLQEETSVQQVTERLLSTTSTYTVEDAVDGSSIETMFERYSDLALGIAFVVISYIAAKRMYVNARQLALATAGVPSTTTTTTTTTSTSAGAPSTAASGTNGTSNGNRTSVSSSNSSSAGAGAGGGAETTVVTAFYSLILVTSVLRATWFLLPLLLTLLLSGTSETTSSLTTTTTTSSSSSAGEVVEMIQSTPVAVYAFDPNSTPGWIIFALSELIVTAGSLTLFSIFILILVYWADILKKYYNPGSRRTLPMATFLGLVATLVSIEIINLLLFLFGFYSTEGMILINSIVLAIVSIICVCEITIFSKKFQNVLKTLGAINQVSTDNQIRRIVWITVTGNLFFFSRALLETIFATMLVLYYFQYGTINKVFTHTWWDIYTLFKYWSEITILALMLHILQSRFSSNNNNNNSTSRQSNTSGGTQQPSQSNTVGYSKIPDASVNV